MSPPAGSLAVSLPVSPGKQSDGQAGGQSLGAFVAPGGTRFAAFATGASACGVRLYGGDGTAPATHPLTEEAPGLFAGRIAGVGPGARYKFVIERDGETRELPDPYARFLPDGVHAAAEVTSSSYEFRHAGVFRPLSEQVIYELHVGTFSPEGTYAGVRQRLPELRDLGVTAIELMPLAAFDGQRGWGYDGVALFAPFAGYGHPDELRALVDEAHGLGLAVFLDVVYNHFGPAGNYLSAYAPEYFTSDIQNGWGDAPDFRHPVVRQMVLDNARYWLQEFRFDGLRLDATHAIIDPSPRHILADLADLARELEPQRLLIAEDERNEPALIEQHGLDAIWADDFHHQLRVTLTGERDGYYGAYQPGVAGLARAIEQGWLYTGQVYKATGHPRGHDAGQLSADRFVYCIQNHDQVGNRALGERLNHQVPLEAFHVASTVLLYLPMTPLLFMGQEWAASSPFLFFTDHEPSLGELVSKGRREEFKSFRAFADPTARASIPDPQDTLTFERSRLDWSERDSGPHGRTLTLYRQLIQLRRNDPVLSSADRAGLEAKAITGDGQLLLVRRSSPAGSRLLLANLGTERATVPGPQLQGHRRPLFTTGPSAQMDTREEGDLLLPGFTALILGN